MPVKVVRYTSPALRLPKRGDLVHGLAGIEVGGDVDRIDRVPGVSADPGTPRPLVGAELPRVELEGCPSPARLPKPCPGRPRGAPLSARDASVQEKPSSSAAPVTKSGCASMKAL